MDCSKLSKLIDDYGRGALGGSRSLIVEGHIVKCNNCRKKLISVKRHKSSKKLFALVVAIGFFGLILSQTLSVPGFLKKINPKKAASNIIIEVSSKNIGYDEQAVSKIAQSKNYKIVNIKPFSVELAKKDVSNFIRNMNAILVFPSDTVFRVQKFIAPLDNDDQVVIKIKFIKDTNQDSNTA